MADSVVTEQHPPNNDLYTEFDCLPMPPLDPIFFSYNNNNSNNMITSLPEPHVTDLGIDDDVDFDFTFDDLYTPSETEEFLSGDFFADGFFSEEPNDALDGVFVQDPTDRSSDSPISSQIPVDRNSDVRVLNLSDISGENSSSSVRVLNFHSIELESGAGDQKSGDGSSRDGRVLKSTSQECGSGSNRDSSGPVSSQGSGNCGSGLEAMNSASPDSGNCERDVSSNSVVDQNVVKFEEMERSYMSKRKKEHEDANLESSRSSKFRRSSMAMDDVSNVGNDEDEKKKARLMRNRESAQLSRQRKKHYVEELEDKLRAMHSTVQELNSKISYFMAENATLRQQLNSGGNGMCPPPHPGMYPHPSMAPMAAYPWVPAPYMVKPQGSQVPLVPIPRLKLQPLMSAPKSKKSDKENKKTEGKTKKVASVSFLGLLFFMLLFGGLVPMINVKYRGDFPGVSDYVGNRFRGQHLGSIFTVNGHSNGSDDYVVGAGSSNGKVDFGNRIHRERFLREGEELDVGHKQKGSQPLTGSDRFGHSANSSEPLVASLYVPRNDKLVKIDGNLIIHSVLASEKAMSSSKASGTTNSEHTGLAIARNFPPALAYSEVGRNQGRNSYLYRNPTERQRALTSGSADASKDNVKSADGKLQQWFREGLAGPMLSSGMCTEVFHFDISPASASGAIVPASSVTNKSIDQRQNSTHLNNGKNRRFLGQLPVPFNESTLNVTEEHGGKNSQKNSFGGKNNSLSSMVVSVLVDPREVGDGEGDGMIGQKSLSRIFVVVLMDSVKYVTYSCMLPLKGSGPHLVTT